MPRPIPDPRMICFNLLAHREQSRQQSRQRVQWLLGGMFMAGVAVLIGLLIDLHLRQDQQQQRTQLLHQELRILEQQITQTKLLEKELQGLSRQLATLGRLQQQRNDAVRLLNQLAQSVPAGIYLRAVKQEGQHISLHGHATSPLEITHLLDQLRQTDTLTHAQLRHITQTGERHEFIVTSAVPEQYPQP